jgi:hypothetical protein
VSHNCADLTSPPDRSPEKWDSTGLQCVPATVFLPTVGNRRRTAARTIARVVGPAWEARANASRA